MAAMDCGTSQFTWGRDRAAVQNTVDKWLCTTEKQCTDGEYKLSCSKRSTVAPSKEDPKLFIGLAWCPCPKDVPTGMRAKRGERVVASKAIRPRKVVARKPVRKKKP
jgi:hypothetical protein